MYIESERNVFSVIDDTGTAVWYDPLEVWRRYLFRLRQSPNDVLQAAHSPDPVQAFEAKQLLIDAIRFAFQFKAFDRLTGHGATEDVILNALNRLHDFQAKKKVPIVNSPPGSPSTAMPMDDS